MRRAFIFTMDAIVALLPIFILVGAVSTMNAGEAILLRGQFVGLHYAASDLAAVSEKAGYIDDMGGMFTNYTNLRKEGDSQWKYEKANLLDYINETVLPLVVESKGFAVEFWGVYENGTSYLDIEYTTDNRTMTGQNNRPYENVSSKSFASVKLASGYEKDVPLVGYTARGWIDRVERRLVNKVYFADPIYHTSKVGPSRSNPRDWISVSYNVTVPINDKANISNVTWYLAPVGVTPDAEVCAYLNGIKVYPTGSCPGSISGFYAVQNSTLYPYIQPGYNNFTMRTKWNPSNASLGSGDKASRVIVTYYTDETSEGYPTRFPLETAYSPVHLADYEKPIFVPNTDVENLSVTLRAFGKSVTLGFQYNNTIIPISTKTLDGATGQWKTVTWTDTEIRSALNGASPQIYYTDLKDKYFKFLFNIEGV